MTCAACANRVERSLNKLPGVAASVNYATEKATVGRASVDGGAERPSILARSSRPSRRPGTRPRSSCRRRSATTRRPRPRVDTLAPLRQRLAIVVALTVPVLVLSMVPALQFTYWQWLVLTLAAPVAVWGAWPFHRAAVHQRPPRRRHDGHAHQRRCGRRLPVEPLRSVPWRGRHARHDHELQLFGTPEAGAHEIYLEVAAAVTAFMLAGRYLEAKAKRASRCGARRPARPGRDRRDRAA